EYYNTILDDLKEIKIVPYVIPGRTGTAISAEDLAVLAQEYDRLIAIKEATGDLERMKKERALMPSMGIISGDDDKTFPMMNDPQIRANGVISVMSNIVPGAVSEMVDAALEGNQQKAQETAQKLGPLFSIVTVKARSERSLADGKKLEVQDKFRNPLAVKTAMHILGMPAGAPRKPLGKMTPEGTSIVKNVLKKLLQDSPEILEPIGEFYQTDIESRINNDNLWEKLTYSSC
ncbi:MAG: dihydrodipicolinate synthase family protein, partial [Spirochaetota bacterium]